MLGDKRLISTIKLHNFLSFGPSSAEIEADCCLLIVLSRCIGHLF